MSKAKYEYAKIQQETLLEDMSQQWFFIDFGLLRSPYCKISYLLAEERRRHTDNSWIDGTFWQSFLSNVHKSFLFFHIFTF